MINLIPPAAKRAVRREYWQRVFVVWLVLLNVCLVLGGLLTAPSFVLVQSQLTAYQSQLESAAAVASEQDQLAATITDTNERARTVLAAAEVPAMTPYLERLRALASAGVAITQVRVIRTEALVTELVVSGEARSRESLRRFSEQIVADERFAAADVPLENLAANEDIAFSLSIVVANDT